MSIFLNPCSECLVKVVCGEQCDESKLYEGLKPIMKKIGELIQKHGTIISKTKNL